MPPAYRVPCREGCTQSVVLHQHRDDTFQNYIAMAPEKPEKFGQSHSAHVGTCISVSSVPPIPGSRTCACGCKTNMVDCRRQDVPTSHTAKRRQEVHAPPENKGPACCCSKTLTPVCEQADSHTRQQREALLRSRRRRRGTDTDEASTKSVQDATCSLAQALHAGGSAIHAAARELRRSVTGGGSYHQCMMAAATGADSVSFAGAQALDAAALAQATVPLLVRVLHLRWVLIAHSSEPPCTCPKTGRCCHQAGHGRGASSRAGSQLGHHQPGG